MTNEEKDDDENAVENTMELETLRNFRKILLYSTDFKNNLNIAVVACEGNFQ